VSVYLDASVIMPTLVVEGATTAVAAYLRGTTAGLLVSEFVAAEVASGISRLLRMKDLSLDEAQRALSRFDAWRASDTTSIAIENDDIGVAHRIVRRFELKLRAPDALHLALCLRAGAQLATLDGDLAYAATHLGASVASP